MFDTTLIFLLAALQQGAAFGPNAPKGTGLEWMVLTSLVLPALVIVLLVYLGRPNTV